MIAVSHAHLSPATNLKTISIKSLLRCQNNKQSKLLLFLNAHYVHLYENIFNLLKLTPKLSRLYLMSEICNFLIVLTITVCFWAAVQIRQNTEITHPSKRFPAFPVWVENPLWQHFQLCFGATAKSQISDSLSLPSVFEGDAHTTVALLKIVMGKYVFKAVRKCGMETIWWHCYLNTGNHFLLTLLTLFYYSILVSAFLCM